MKLHEILIGVVVMSLVVTGMISFIGLGATQYGVADYNSTSISVLNKFETLNSTMDEARQDLQQLETSSGVLDILGEFFQGAYDSLKVIGGSYSAMFDIVRDGISQIPGLGSYSASLIGTITLIILIVIFIGIIMAAIIKSDRI